MKKYLVFLGLLIVSAAGFSQTPRARVLIGQDTATNKGGVLYKDTIKTLVCSGCTFSKGTYSDTITVTGGGGSSTANFYLKDSTLSGPRTVTMAGNQLTWASSTIARMTLSSSGTGSQALLEALNSAGNGLQMGVLGPSQAASGLVTSGSSFIQSNIGDLFIQSAGTGHPIHITSNGVELAKWDGTFFTTNQKAVETITIGASPSSGLDVLANYFNVTSPTNSSATYGCTNIYAPLAPGYTGSVNTSSIYAINSAAGTANGPSNGSGYGMEIQGNFGFRGYSGPTTTGTNIGVAGQAVVGNVNFGGWFSATALKNSATNIGVAGWGLNTGTSPIEVGGYFSLYTSNTALPTFVSAALIADNGAEAQPVFLARVNGATKVSIDAAGDLVTTAGVSYNVTNVSATGTYSATGTDYTIQFTGSTATLVYPTVNLVKGRHLNIVNNGSGTLTIPSTKTGNASTITSLTTGQRAQVEYDLTNTTWIQVN